MVPYKGINIKEPAPWVQLWLQRQRQAEDDMVQLYNAVVGKENRDTMAFKQIEAYYDQLYHGTKFLYEAIEHNKRAIDDKLSTELMAVSKNQETFAREVQQMIALFTADSEAKKRTERVEVIRVQQAVDFMERIAEARGNEEKAFRNNLSQWAGTKDRAIATLEDRLAQSVDEIKRQQKAIQTQKEDAEAQARRIEELEQEADNRQQWDPAPRTTSPIWVDDDMEAIPREKGKKKETRRPPRVPRTLTYESIRELVLPGRHEARSPPAQRNEGRGPPPPLPPRGNTGVGGSPPSSSSNSSASRGPPTPPRRPQPPQQHALALTREELLALLAGRQGREERRHRPTNIKLAQPPLYNGEKATKFRPWWQAIETFFLYHHDQEDYEKIAFVSTRLEGKALEWHQARQRILGNTDTWGAYAQEMQEHYADRSERATARHEIKALKYKNDIQAYLIDLESLNRYAGITGEDLYETVDQALGDEIIKTRSYRTRGTLDNDADYIQATREAGLEHETLQRRLAALKAQKSAFPTSGKVQYFGTQETQEEGKHRKGGKSGRKERKREDEEESGGRKSGRKTQQDQGADVWKNAKDALAGIAQHEIDEHKSIAGRNGCWRCGNQNHRTFKCYAGKTKAGTPLPKAPTKGAAATTSSKRKREEEEDVKEESPAPKQQKVSAVQEQDEDMRERPVWAQISDSEQEDGAVTFMNKYLASATTAKPHSRYRSARLPSRQEWEEEIAREEAITCPYCGYGHDVCEC